MRTRSIKGIQVRDKVYLRRMFCNEKLILCNDGHWRLGMLGGDLPEDAREFDDCQAAEDYVATKDNWKWQGCS